MCVSLQLERFNRNLSHGQAAGAHAVATALGAVPAAVARLAVDVAVGAVVQGGGVQRAVAVSAAEAATMPNLANNGIVKGFDFRRWFKFSHPVLADHLLSCVHRLAATGAACALWSLGAHPLNVGAEIV